MWSRGYLKSRAKDVLRDSYWKAFLVSLIVTILAGNGGAGSSSFNFRINSHDVDKFKEFIKSINSEALPFYIIIALGIASLIFILGLAFKIFIGYPIEVGGRRYFLSSAQKDVNMNYIGYSFSKYKYGNIVKTMLWKGILNFLWYLLLFVPGVIKHYAYSMVPYILADNPNIDNHRAIELSNKMTKGEKFEIFILDLSFIGWFILGALALGVGVLFVLPYYNSTKAELYMILRKRALEEGLCSREELNLLYDDEM